MYDGPLPVYVYHVPLEVFGRPEAIVKTTCRGCQAIVLRPEQCLVSKQFTSHPLLSVCAYVCVCGGRICLLTSLYTKV